MTDVDKRREAAVKRLEAKRDFNIHVAIYAIVNVMLVVIWAVSGRGYFWPIWPILGWGVAVVIHGWMTFLQKPITEDDIRREMEKGG
jgi:2TM domain